LPASPRRPRAYLATAYNKLGDVLEIWKQYPEAETALRKAIRLQPSDASAHNNLGVALQQLKRYREAEAAYREAIRLAPGSTARNNLASLPKR
jgi:Flp pilus assembly protein TadD